MQPQDKEQQLCYSNKQAHMSKKSSLNLWTLAKQTIMYAAVTALNGYFFPKVNSVFAHQKFHQL